MNPGVETSRMCHAESRCEHIWFFPCSGSSLQNACRKPISCDEHALIFCNLDDLRNACMCQFCLQAFKIILLIFDIFFLVFISLKINNYNVIFLCQMELLHLWLFKKDVDSGRGDLATCVCSFLAIKNINFFSNSI